MLCRFAEGIEHVPDGLPLRPVEQTPLGCAAPIGKLKHRHPIDRLKLDPTGPGLPGLADSAEHAGGGFDILKDRSGGGNRSLAKTTETVYNYQ